MQVEGYNLDAQKDKLRKYADYQEMSVVGEHSDAGKAGWVDGWKLKNRDLGQRMRGICSISSTRWNNK